MKAASVETSATGEAETEVESQEASMEIPREMKEEAASTTSAGSTPSQVSEPTESINLSPKSTASSCSLTTQVNLLAFSSDDEMSDDTIKGFSPTKESSNTEDYPQV